MNEIHEFVVKSVKGKRQKVGVMFATMNDKNEIQIGISKVNFKAGDKFDKEKGLKLAMEKSKAKSILVPESLKYHFREFQDRCSRYFKGGKIIV